MPIGYGFWDVLVRVDFGMDFGMCECKWLLGWKSACGFLDGRLRVDFGMGECLCLLGWESACGF